jgi:hypothetical protein
LRTPAHLRATIRTALRRSIFDSTASLAPPTAQACRLEKHACADG